MAYDEGILAWEVAAISPLGNQLERHLFAAPCQPQRRMWFLDPFGFVDCLLDGVIFPTKCRIVLSPHAMNNLSRLAEARQPLTRVWITVPVGTKFVFVPACAKAQDKAAVTHYIQR